MVMVPLPSAPLDGVTLHHVTSSITIASQDTFVVNEKLTVPPSGENDGAVSAPSANVIPATAPGCCSIRIHSIALPALILTDT